MNYGFDETTPGWKREKKNELASELIILCAEYGGGGDSMRFSGNPYVEVDGLYQGVRLRKLTHLPEEVVEELVKRADEIFCKVMEVDRVVH
jgi:hypothetical protein